MSTLLIDELYTGVTFSQDVRISSSQVLAFVRPWIYKQGTLADGQLRLEIYDGATLLKTIDIDYTDINAAITSPYAHGYIRFDVEPLALNVADDEDYHTYTFEFSMVNYTNDTNNFIGVCRDWDDPKYVVYNGPAASDSIASMGLEFYTYRS